MTRNTATFEHITGLIETCHRRSQDAAKFFEKATLLEPENRFHWLALGLTYLETEAPVEALRAFDAVLQLNPNDIVANSHSYDALMAVGDIEEAQQRLQQTLELFPQDLRSLKRRADYRCSRGLVFGKEGKQTKGIIQTMLSIAPDAAYGFDSLAQYHLLRGEWKEGVAVLQQCVEQ
ncbi:MAG: tetratricopeptide repeat protein, partial [Coleofasciculus sp. C2-GNP5-27]